MSDAARWGSAALGVICVVLGAVLTLRPFRSLGVLLVLIAIGLLVAGIVMLAGRGAMQRVLGAVLVLAAAAVLLVPGLTINLLTWIVAGALIVTGTGRLLGLRTSVADERLSVALLALASVVLGVVALSWRDVTVLVIAALFGVQLVLFGIGQLMTAIRPEAPQRSKPATGVRRFWRTIGAAVALLAALGLLLLSIRLTGHPRPDAFYDPPAEIPAEPGRLLRAEAFTTDIPEGATGWRILYTTTLDDSTPAVTSAIVVAPDGGAEHPVIAWAHGTTGQAVGCAPSLLEHPFEAGAMPDLPGTLAQGWAVVAPDYPGLGAAGSHPYLIGEPTGRSVLDAIRAAQDFDEAALGTETVVWGHSQGGHAALWTGGLATRYAPELDIRGVVAMAPAANLTHLLGDLAESPLGSLFGAYIITAWTEAYPEVHFNDFVRPAARIGMQEMAARCLSDPSVLVSVATALAGNDPVWSGDPAREPMLARAEQNTPRLPVEVPLLIAQGETDTVVLPAAQREFVTERCEAGQRLEYRTYPGLDHMGLVTGESPLLNELKEWTAERFAGGEFAPTC